MRCEVCHTEDRKALYHLSDCDVLKCKNCGLVFIDLTGRDDAFKDLYSSEYFNTRDKYNPDILDVHGNEFGTAVTSEFLKGLETIENVRKRGRLLDVGCGTGIFLNMARKRGWEVSGVDVSDYAAHIAKERFGLQVDLRPLTEIKFPSGYFDVITLWDSIEHFSHPSLYLREINRILKHDGILILNTPNENSLSRTIARLLYHVSFGLFKYPARRLYHKYHSYYFSEQTIKALLADSGYSLIQLNKKSVPIEKVPVLNLEKFVVMFLFHLERISHREYEFFIIAGKGEN